MQTVIWLIPFLLVLACWVAGVALVIRDILRRRRRRGIPTAADERRRRQVRELRQLAISRWMVIGFWLTVMSLVWMSPYVGWIGQIAVTIWFTGILIIGGLISIALRERELLYDLRHAAGCCVTCGYDLRASKDRCPECGAATAPAVCPMRNRPIKPWWNSAGEL